ncbi:MAG TPA: ABC transporter substrate-binding protein [Steroidobacteraceae bacterium]|jgi:putative ABC transport system substrate-binding protein
MRRRKFLALIGAAAAWPLVARAQEPRRVHRLGVLHQLPRTAPQFAQLFDGLRREGFIEGRNLVIDSRGFDSRSEQYKERTALLINSGVDVLVCGGDLTIREVQEVTRTVSIVGIADDMLASGLVASLARPGGNTTGISILTTELDGKRQELLLELVPDARRMAALVDPDSKSATQLQEMLDAARARGLELLTYRVTSTEEIVSAVDAAHAAGAAGLNAMASVMINASRQVIIDRTAALRLPAIYQFPEAAEQGGFAAYGPRIEQIYRQLALPLARLFRGERPQDIPVQQPTTFELVINLKTAKGLGLTIPEALLIRADKVIE